MEKHIFNSEESKRIKEQIGTLIQPKMCYNNTFQVVTYNYQKFHSEEWKIAYGFVTAIDGVMARHAFIVNDKGEAIDPTLSHYNDKEYLSFKTLNMEEYLNLLEEHDREPALYNAFRNEEQEVRLWAFEERILLCD